MESTIFTKSESANSNYLAAICRIGETHPIEGADRIVSTTVNGFTMIVSKEMKEGDIVVYFPVETAICEKYLSANNLYEIGQFEKNSNVEEVKKILTESEALPDDDTEGKLECLNKAKSMCGFFNKYGRVRILKLKGKYSEGFIAPTDTLVKFDESLKDINWEDYVGTSFDAVNGEKLCEKFVPVLGDRRRTNGPSGQSRWRKTMKKLRAFKSIIPGEFCFHYETVKLQSEMDKLSPDDNVTITLKFDGTSAILSNVKCKRVGLTIWEKIMKFFGIAVKDIVYENIYSSRRVIKNEDINPEASTRGFHDKDVWTCCNNVFGKYIPKGMTVYGEIIGYEDGTERFIQKNHDYGCEKGKWKFMPYRITTDLAEGGKKEWDVLDVDKWIHDLVAEHPELSDYVQFLVVLYHGRFGDLYPDIDTQQHWHENVLERMKNDKEHFGMEEDEPLCKNKVPREGIVIRIDGDKFARAWKLKTMRHLAREGKMNDSGEVNIEDIS